MSQTHDTAIGVAFSNAGFRPPQEYTYDDALEIATEAWRKWPDKNSGGGARLDHVMFAIKGSLAIAVITNTKEGRLAFRNSVADLLLDAQIGYEEEEREKRNAQRRTQADVAPVKPDGRPRAVSPSSGPGQEGNDIHVLVAQPATSPIPRDTGIAPVGGGQVNFDTQAIAAPAAPSRDDARPQAEHRSEPAIHFSTPINRVPAAPHSTSYGTLLEPPVVRPRPAPIDIKTLADRHEARMKMRVKVETQSCLDTIMVKLEGWTEAKPLGQCIVAEGRRFRIMISSNIRNDLRIARTVDSLIGNLPGNVVIGEYWKPEDAERFYEMAALDASQKAKLVGCGV